MTKHGTISRYTSGCRCARCRGANAGYQRAYQARRRGAAAPLTIGFPSTTAIVMGSTITTTQTATGAWTYNVRSPLEQLVDACIDLREAFAAYHQAHTEPLS